MSPERKASQALRNLCTFTAAKIVLSQLEGSGRGGLASYDTKVSTTCLPVVFSSESLRKAESVKAYADLREHMENEPLRDDEAWISALLRKNELLGALTPWLTYLGKCSMENDLRGKNEFYTVLHVCPLVLAGTMEDIA